MQFETDIKKYNDPEEMAAAYLVKYFENKKIKYPINPFQMLKDEGILFSLMDFKKLEGVYIPAASADDVPTVGINVNRPITRLMATGITAYNKEAAMNTIFNCQGILWCHSILSLPHQLYN